MFILIALLTGCGPDSDEDCVAYGESCGCASYCGTTWDEQREASNDQCLIGCTYPSDDTGLGTSSPITDDDCIAVENECQWTDEVKAAWPDLTLE